MLRHKSEQISSYLMQWFMLEMQRTRTYQSMVKIVSRKVTSGAYSSSAVICR